MVLFFSILLTSYTCITLDSHTRAFPSHKHLWDRTKQAPTAGDASGFEPNWVELSQMAPTFKVTWWRSPDRPPDALPGTVHRSITTLLGHREEEPRVNVTDRRSTYGQSQYCYHNSITIPNSRVQLFKSLNITLYSFCFIYLFRRTQTRVLPLLSTTVAPRNSGHIEHHFFVDSSCANSISLVRRLWRETPRDFKNSHSFFVPHCEVHYLEALLYTDFRMHVL